MMNAYSVRMTSCRPRQKKAIILEKMYEIAVELGIKSLAIEGRSPIFLTMSIPQQMMSYPRAVPHP